MSRAKPSVYVSKPWAEPTIRLFSRYGYPIAPTIKSADIVAFNGGEDINPQIYGERSIPAAGVYFNNDRDMVELQDYAASTGKFKFGICRGGQLLNCLNGGRLWQDVDSHNRAHDMVDLETGETIYTSSVHHQQFILGPEARLIAAARLSRFKLGHYGEDKSVIEWCRDDYPDDDPLSDDPEVIWYEKDRALCIQGHPEYGGYSKFTDYCMNLAEKYA